MKTFFTSDTHFNHENIINYCKRPFSNVAEMNTILIDNINATVDKHDRLFHLGDFSMRIREKELQDIKDRIICKNIVLIQGNHDSKYVNRVFPEVKDLKYISIEEGSKQKLMLSHYPMISWRGMSKGSIHLHGHTHNTLKVYHSHAVEVGVDVPGLHFTPISYQGILDIIEERMSKKDWKQHCENSGMEHILIN